MRRLRPAETAAAGTAGEAAPVQAPASSSSGSQTLWIGLGVLGVGVLVAGAYMLGRRR